jgi:hypothetical protein
MKKQYVFELSWSWYEEYCPQLFIHPNKTEKEFKSDVHSLIKKYISEYIDAEKSWVNMSDYIRFIGEKLPEFGYEQFAPVSVGFFGGFILKDRDQDSEWVKILGEEMFSKAVAHNKKIEDKMFESDLPE